MEQTVVIAKPFCRRSGMRLASCTKRAAEPPSPLRLNGGALIKSSIYMYVMVRSSIISVYCVLYTIARAQYERPCIIIIAA